MTIEAELKPSLTLGEICAPVSSHLEIVGCRVRQVLSGAFELFDGQKRLDLGVRGKMVRPAMQLLSALAIEADDLETLVDMAAACELIHCSTLIHDDVVDEADTRRGSTSVNVAIGNRLAVLAGDYVFAKSISILCGYRDEQIVRHMMETVGRMVAGEVDQVAMEQNSDSTKDDYLRVIEAKTSVLMSTACSLPARHFACDKDYIDALDEYGRNCGIAFQIIDDLLDVCGNQRDTGKPKFADLRAGKVTLPILYLREELAPNAEDVRRLDAILQGLELSQDDCEWVAGNIVDMGIDVRCRIEADLYAAQARKAIAILPEGPGKNSLQELASFFVSREH